MEHPETKPAPGCGPGGEAPPPDPPLGRLIRNARLDAGLTQYELARKTSINCCYMSQIECGTGHPSAGLLRKIAEATGSPWLLDEIQEAPPPDPSTVGGRVRKARLDAGLTQGALAKKAGVGREYLNSIERGKHVPSPDFLHKIAEATGAPWLPGGTREMPVREKTGEGGGAGP